MEVKAGQIIALTEGEYSDYCLKDHVSALVDFDTKKLVIEFMRGEGEGTYGCDQTNKFLAWLIKEGKVEPLEPGLVVEWWTGYGGLKV